MNTSITLTATATGGTNVSYQFWAYSATTQSWSQLPASSNSCTWTPAAAGWYYLTVSAQDGVSGTVVTAATWYGVSSLTAVTLNTSPVSPQPVNTPITLTASATGGSNGHYQFWCYSAATGTGISYRPSPPPKLRVGHRTLPVFISSPPPRRTAAAAGRKARRSGSPSRPRADGGIAGHGSPLPAGHEYPDHADRDMTGGTAVQYQFWAYSATTQSWSQLQGLSTSPTCSWTPTTAGWYYLSVTAQDVTGARSPPLPGTGQLPLTAPHDSARPLRSRSTRRSS